MSRLFPTLLLLLRIFHASQLSYSISSDESVPASSSEEKDPFHLKVRRHAAT